MEEKKIHITIIDTYENDRNLILEKTQIDSPRLIYNGSDPKLDNVLGSELNFNLLVDDLGVSFFHLYDGNEKRYKVVLEKEYQDLSKKVVWEGFLLPEQFSEPYKKPPYFIDFVATDGLGLLRGKYLTNEYYSERHSVVEILTKCLLATKLEYKLLIAMAFNNSLIDLKFADFEIDSSCYVSSGKKMDIYSILEAILKSFGLKLFQLNQCWYCIGSNRIGQQELLFEEYDEFGSYLGEKTINRNLVNKKFNVTPLVDVKPPLKSVDLTWEKNIDGELLPLDFVAYMPSDLTQRSSKYFQVVGLWQDQIVGMHGKSLGIDFTGISKTLDEIHQFYVNDFLVKPNSFIISDVYYFSIYGCVSSVEDLKENYVRLNEPIYLNKDEKIELKLRFDFSCFDSKEVVKSKFENGEFNSVFYYSLTYKKYLDQTDVQEDLLFGNLPGLLNNELYNFKLSFIENDKDGYYVSGELHLKDVLIASEGYYNLRLYPVVDLGLNTERIRVYECQMSSNKKSKEILIKNRTIDFTSKIEDEVFHSSSKEGGIVSNLLIDSEIELDYNIYEPSENIKLEVFSYNHTIDVPFTGWERLEIKLNNVPKKVFNNLLNKKNVFLRKAGVGSFIGLTNFFVFVDSDGYVTLLQVYVPINGLLSSDFFISENDEIYVTSDLVDITISNTSYALNKWKRIGESESLELLDVQNRLIHDMYDVHKFIVSGELRSFVSPLDLIEFNNSKYKIFTPFYIENNLIDVSTSLKMVEVSNSKVLDYEE